MLVRGVSTERVTLGPLCRIPRLAGLRDVGAGWASTPVWVPLWGGGPGAASLHGQDSGRTWTPPSGLLCPPGTSSHAYKMKIKSLLGIESFPISPSFSPSFLPLPSPPLPRWVFLAHLCAFADALPSAWIVCPLLPRQLFHIL